jgi:hypothetical protein
VKCTILNYLTYILIKARIRFTETLCIPVIYVEIGWEGVDWMHLAQNKYKWRAVVNTGMNFGVP